MSLDIPYHCNKAIPLKPIDLPNVLIERNYSVDQFMSKVRQHYGTMPREEINGFPEIPKRNTQTNH